MSIYINGYEADPALMTGDDVIPFVELAGQRDTWTTVTKFSALLDTLPMSGGTANGVLYLNGSKVVTSGSGLTFDGSNMGVGSAAGSNARLFAYANDASLPTLLARQDGAAPIQVWQGAGGAELMRFDSTGLGIGTSSPISRLQSVDGDITVTTSSSFVGFNSTRAFTPSGVGQQLGRLHFSAYSTGTTYVQGASIQAFSSAAWSSTSAPSYLSFQTTASGSTSLTETMRLDSSGNLGLGATPSAWGSGWTALQVGSRTVVHSAPDSRASFGNNYYVDGTNAIYIASAPATQLMQVNGDFRFFISTDLTPTAGNSISFTQAMTLDASGLLQVGLTSNTGGGRVDVLANATSAYVARSTSTTGANGGTSVTSVRTVDSSASYWANAQYDAWQHIFRVSGSTEAARIDSSGNLLVGGTSSYRNGRLVIKDVNRTQASTNANLHISTTDSQAADLGGSIGLGGQVGNDESPFAYVSGRKENSISGNYAGYLAFAVQNSAAAVIERARITSTGSFVAGAQAALATSATDGFLYVPTCAGTPTGTPTPITGTAPIVVDTTNNKLYFYSGGQWRDAGP